MYRSLSQIRRVYLYLFISIYQTSQSMQLSNYQKFFISKLCVGFYLRWAIAALYLISKNIETSQAMRLISFYSFLVVVLEYPTWVIGDTLWHKTSVLRWTFFNGVGILLMCIDVSLWQYYLIPLTIIALWTSLESWSDIGLMKSITPDFKSIYPSYKSKVLLTKFSAAIVAWFLFKISPLLPVFIYGILCFVWTAFVRTIDDPHIKWEHSITSGNIFKTAKQWFATVFSSPILIILLVSYAITSGYTRTIKTTINSLYEYFSVDVVRLTIAVWMTYLAGAAWAYSSKWLSEKQMNRIPSLIAFITLIMSILTYTLSNGDRRTILAYFIVCAYLIAAVRSLMTMYISSEVPSSVISSALSLYNLCWRLFTSVYLLWAWYILWRFNVSTLFLVTAIIFFAVAWMNLCYSLYRYYWER